MLPQSMLTVLLVAVIKDKTGKISSIENYRPIALANIISKVFEHILMDRLKEYLLQIISLVLRGSMVLIYAYIL